MIAIKPTGSVLRIEPSRIIVSFPGMFVGCACDVLRRDGSLLQCEVVAVSEKEAIVVPFGAPEGIAIHAAVYSDFLPVAVTIPLDPRGLVLNSYGDILDGTAASTATATLHPLTSNSPNPLTRTAINQQMLTGICGIDTLTPIGYGQRLGICAGPGVGKSTLLGMICRHADVDVVVYCAVGERGREVKDTLDEVIGPYSRHKTVMIVATSDEPAMARRCAPYLATAIAEMYRDQGKRVLLLVDSLTRTARALREVSLAAGERELRGGLTSYVLRELPLLLERAGTNAVGSITALYTLLTETDVEQDPLANEVKSILDGHLILSPTIANRGIYPAVDYLRSKSRLTHALLNESADKDRQQFLNALARLDRDRDLVLFGGTPDPELEQILKAEPSINSFLNQGGSGGGDHAAAAGELSRINRLFG